MPTATAASRSASGSGRTAASTRWTPTATASSTATSSAAARCPPRVASAQAPSSKLQVPSSNVLWSLDSWSLELFPLLRCRRDLSSHRLSLRNDERRDRFGRDVPLIDPLVHRLRVDEERIARLVGHRRFALVIERERAIGDVNHRGAGVHVASFPSANRNLHRHEDGLETWR